MNATLSLSNPGANEARWASKEFFRVSSNSRGGLHSALKRSPRGDHYRGNPKVLMAELQSKPATSPAMPRRGEEAGFDANDEKGLHFVKADLSEPETNEALCRLRRGLKCNLR